METILSSLKSVWQTLKNKDNLFTVLITLLVASNAYSLGFSNIILVLLIIYILFFQKIEYNMKLNLVVPILFFVIMILSVFWTTDKLATIKAISKEIYFLIIPILFLLKSKKNNFL